MSNRTPFTEEDIKDISNKYLSGMCYDQIAKKYHCCANKIRNRLIKSGIKSRGKNIGEAWKIKEIFLINQLLNDGKSDDAIYESFLGKSPASIDKKISEYRKAGKITIPINGNKKYGENLVGKRYEKLLVIEYLNKIKHPELIGKASNFILCKCDCGKEVIVRIANLVNKVKIKATKSCGCDNNNNNLGSKNNSWKGYKEISGSFLCNVKSGAKKRNIDFDLTIEQLWELFIKQGRKCALSGLELRFRSRHGCFDGTASVDRIDSSKGYFISNIQFIHKHINWMKLDHSEEVFIKYCNLITDYQRAKVLA